MAPIRRPRSRTRREELFQSLEEIFLREGFRRVTVGELASRLRCSRRALYDLAPTKEALFLFVLDHLLRRIRALGRQAARSTADLGKRLEAYVVPGVTQTAAATQFFSADIASFPASRRMMEEHQRERIRGLSEIVAEGVRRGIFRGFDPHLVAEICTLNYRRATQPDFLSQANLSMSEAFRELGQLLLHGLLHPQNNGSSGRDRKGVKRRTRLAMGGERT